MCANIIIIIKVLVANHKATLYINGPHSNMSYNIYIFRASELECRCYFKN